jgi:hypothetical protein
LWVTVMERVMTVMEQVMEVKGVSGTINNKQGDVGL